MKLASHHVDYIKKEFCFENFFNILPLPLSKCICKYRCLSHNLPIEKGGTTTKKFEKIQKMAP